MKKFLIPFLIVLTLPSLAFADFQSYIGSFVQPTSTGNQSITGLGFKPKVVIFWWNAMTADGSAADATIGLGFAISSSSRQSVSGSYKNGGTVTNKQGSYRDRSSVALNLIHNNGAGGVDSYGEADFVSNDVGGFTVNWTTVDQVNVGSQPIVNYLALGGSDITNQYTGAFGSGSTTVTGVGFKPDFLMFIYDDLQGLPPITGNTGYQTAWSFIAGTSSQQTILGDSLDDVPNTDDTFQSPYAMVVMNMNTIFGTSSIASMNSDGFTFDGGSQRYGQYLALKGGQYSVGSFNQPTSTGNQSITGFGFKPSATFLSSFNHVAAQDTNPTSWELSLGGAVSSSSRSSIFTGAGYNQNPTNSSQNLDRTNVLKMMVNSSTNPTTNAVADFVSNDASGFTINWTTADATQRQVIYASFGANAAAAASTSPTSQLSLTGGTLSLGAGTLKL